MLDGSISGTRLSQCRKLREEGEVGVSRVQLQLNNAWKGRRGVRKNAMNRKMCVLIQENTTTHVNHEAKVMQKISTKNGLFDIGDSEYPPEGPA